MTLNKTAVLSALLAAGLLAGMPLHAADPVSVTAVAPVWRTDVTGTRTESLPLLRLVPGGTARSVKLTGLTKAQYFDFGVRADDVVSEARLELTYTPSPAVIPGISQINVYLNGQLQKSAPIPKEAVGQVSEMSVTLNPKAMEAVNQIAVEFVGHYRQVCENPANESLWLDVGSASRLVLVKQRIRLANDLAQFPAPFVDVTSGAPTVLPMVFAGRPSAAEKEAAAVLASIAGRAAEWRGTDFPVYYNAMPGESHFVVFAPHDDRPDFLKLLPQADGPQVYVADAPGSLWAKMLVIAGRDEKDLVAAVRALAPEKLVMIGERFRVRNPRLPEPRKAYDAPRWINEGEPVAFEKLMQYPGQLTSRGYVLPPVHLPLRLVPDLYMVGDASLGMQVKYRYAKPVNGETAQFRAFVNGYLVDSETLSGGDGRGTRTVMLPSFYGPLADRSASGLALTSVNDLSFSVGYERVTEGGSADNCRSVMLLSHQMEVEPASTVTVKGLFHHAELPDLALWAQSGYPFTVYADLSQTAVLIRDDATEGEVNTMLNAVARMSAVTGAAAVRVAVTGDPASPLLRERDILAVGRMPHLMTDIDAANAMTLQKSVLDAVGGKSKAALLAGTEASLLSENGIAAVVSGESPLAEGRTVVALLTEGASGSWILNDRLVNPASLGGIRGAVAVLSESGEADFASPARYAVGNLPWYYRVWMQIIDRPGVLVLCALLSALTVGLGIFFFMRLWVRRRSS